MKTYRYRVLVLGCKVNQYEAQEIREHLRDLGLQPAYGAEAELQIIHGCAVTGSALRKTCRLARGALRAPGSRWVILTGCAAAVQNGELSRTLAGIVPSGRDFLRRLDEVLADLGVIPREVTAQGKGISSFQERTRAIVKVQDGCDYRCSYCIVPLLRGASRCRSAREVYDEVQRLAAAGYREIVISGVNVGNYAADSCDLAGLLEMLLEVPGIARIRLSSLHPRQLSHRLLNLWRTSDRLAPHLHLPLQSGSDRILRLMRRDYSLSEYIAAVARAREYIRDPAITTDLMVGFPGETVGDFEHTVTAVREIGFARVHVFPFSPRPGTPAADLPGRVQRSEIDYRSRLLRKTAFDAAMAFAQRLVGMDETLIVENAGEFGASGMIGRYLRTEVAGEYSAGMVIKVRIHGIRKGRSGPIAVAEVKAAAAPGASRQPSQSYLHAFAKGSGTGVKAKLYVKDTGQDGMGVVLRGSIPAHQAG